MKSQILFIFFFVFFGSINSFGNTHIFRIFFNLIKSYFESYLELSYARLSVSKHTNLFEYPSIYGKHFRSKRNAKDELDLESNRKLLEYPAIYGKHSNTKRSIQNELDLESPEKLFDYTYIYRKHSKSKRNDAIRNPTFFSARGRFNIIWNMLKFSVYN